MDEVEKQLTLSWVSSSFKKGFILGWVSGLIGAIVGMIVVGVFT